MKHISTDIEIDASPEAVWHVICDLPSYAQWNPFVVTASGDLIVGGKLSVDITSPDGRKAHLKPRIVALEPPTELRWRAELLLPGFFVGEHSFQVHALPSGRSRFVQSERFTGLLAPFISPLLRNTVIGFEAMNVALKHRCEERP